jgi:drug/metabolite transporter (DMT)-like permease
MIPRPELLVLASETILSSYPILIKTVPTNLWTQIVARMGVYGLASFLVILGQPKQLAAVSPTYMGGAGLLNLLHVGTSYKAFSELPAGNAMAIFYAYPIWNIIGAWLLLGEKIPMESIPWIGLAVAGMLCIAQPEVGSLLDTKHPVALICAVLSGVTESCIYFFFKIFGIQDGTFKSMFELYGGSFMWILLALLGKATNLGFSKVTNIAAEIPTLDLSWKVWAPMLLFNGLVGFGGYAMRFSAIPLVSTVIFSVLSFTGIVSAYIFGYLFQGEKPSYLAMLGSIFIIVASAVLLYKNPA